MAPVLLDVVLLDVVLLDVDPSIVRPGWIALVVTVLIGVALALLFFSLRRNVRRISPDLPHKNEVEGEGEDDESPQAPDITGKKA
jgi:protein-S-isoprenylcysteine O-methyltransferase Ste14